MGESARVMSTWGTDEPGTAPPPQRVAAADPAMLSNQALARRGAPLAGLPAGPAPALSPDQTTLLEAALEDVRVRFQQLATDVSGEGSPRLRHGLARWFIDEDGSRTFSRVVRVVGDVLADLEAVREGGPPAMRRVARAVSPTFYGLDTSGRNRHLLLVVLQLFGHLGSDSEPDDEGFRAFVEDLTYGTGDDPVLLEKDRRSSFPVGLSLTSGGGLSVGGGGSGWVVDTSFHGTLREPVIGAWHPTLGVGLTLIGKAAPDAADDERVEKAWTGRIGLQLREPFAFDDSRSDAPARREDPLTAAERRDPRTGFLFGVEAGPALFVGPEAAGLYVGVSAGLHWHVLDVTMGTSFVAAPRHEELGGLAGTLNLSVTPEF